MSVLNSNDNDLGFNQIEDSPVAQAHSCGFDQWGFGLCEHHDQFGMKTEVEKGQSFEAYLNLLTEIELKNESEILDLAKQELQPRDALVTGCQQWFQLEKNSQDARKQFSEPGETKNIPKNFGKQIIKFVKKNPAKVQQILDSIQSGVSYDQLNFELQRRKKSMGKISDLKQLWVAGTRFSAQMRTISHFYLRRHGWEWIFNSRVTKTQSHLKYRTIMLELVSKPHSFAYLKRDC